jgi:ABC-2 type transport system permease protein
MSAAATAYGIVVRDLVRSTRQSGRLIAGLARPFLWVFLVGAGLDPITRLEGGLSYRAFAYPGGIVMAGLFGAMLTAISTVYDREFGMLRLMLASPSGTPAVLAGRVVSASIVGGFQAAIVLACAPLATDVGTREMALGALVIVLVAFTSAALGLLVAARIRSVENFGAVFNVVLFPLLFVSGALYPTVGMPPLLRALARANPVTYMVDLMRHAFSQPAEFTAGTDLVVLAVSAAGALTLAALLFDPERRFLTGKPRTA